MKAILNINAKGFELPDSELSYAEDGHIDTTNRIVRIKKGKKEIIIPFESINYIIVEEGVAIE